MLLDKLAQKYNTDKKINGGHGYTKYYHDYFDSLKLNKLNILELGVREGWSLKLWHEYFINSKIYGIDNNSEKLCPEQFDEKRIIFKIGLQDDEKFLLSLNNNFDIIIDDCSHISNLSIKSFNILFPILKSGGIYVIEDLHVCDQPGYIFGGPTIINYLNNINKLQFNINTVEFFDDKICFIRKN